MNPIAAQNTPETWQRIRERFFRDADASKVLEERTQVVDAILFEAYDRFLARPFPGGLAIVATGGFGRHQLFPCSDIDLLLLTEKETVDEAGRAAISAFLQTLWDAGLRASQSVRTVAECCGTMQSALPRPEVPAHQFGKNLGTRHGADIAIASVQEGSPGARRKPGWSVEDQPRVDCQGDGWCYRRGSTIGR